MMIHEPRACAPTNGADGHGVAPASKRGGSRAGRRLGGARTALLLLLAGLGCTPPTRAALALDPAIQPERQPERGVPKAYHELVDVLRTMPDHVPGPADRDRIVAVARAFQDALASDGNARDPLKTDANNIIVSLSDGSFSGPKSIAALRRDASGSAIEPLGAWHPERMRGAHPNGPLAAKLRQGGEGDCVGLSVVKAFATTPTGSGLLRASVARGADGTFQVVLPGAADTPFGFPAADLDQFGRGDAPASALVAALYRYFRLDPRHGSLPTNKAMALLAMGYGHHERLWDAVSSPSDIANFLREKAPHVGRDVAMVFGGAPDHQGDWSRGDGHAFAVIRIDAATDRLIYTNPWDSSRERTIAISTLARSAAGAPADFETITFDDRHLPPLDGDAAKNKEPR